MRLIQALMRNMIFLMTRSINLQIYIIYMDNVICCPLSSSTLPVPIHLGTGSFLCCIFQYDSINYTHLIKRWMQNILLLGESVGYFILLVAQ